MIKIVIVYYSKWNNLHNWCGGVCVCLHLFVRDLWAFIVLSFCSTLVNQASV